MRSLVWFRGKDLRITDHEPLTRAIADGDVIPLFVLDPYFFSPERARQLPHRMQFLLESIESLRENIAALGSRLLLVSGKSHEVVPELARRFRVERVLAHRWTEPFGRARDEKVQAALGSIKLVLSEGETLLRPGALRTGQGGVFSVYTPFMRAHRKAYVESPGRKPLRAPARLPALPEDVEADESALPTLASLGLTHNPELLRGGERAARERMKAFFNAPVKSYVETRDRMDLAGGSRLSQDLKFGLVSVREVWTAAGMSLTPGSVPREKFENELIWREFSHHSLWDRPHLLHEPFRADFKDFPWRRDGKSAERDLAWWKEGKTGYPVVDAAARQLLHEGFVHNRARMIAASFLTKHLLIDYKLGEVHYLRYLTDGDWAQNNAGWQWSAGCGCDAQPYFRVFNPVTQGERFDPDGAYVRRWVPELAMMRAKYIHSPWDAPPEDLARAGVTLGKTYPRPIVEHAAARVRFLATAKKHLAST